MRRFVLAVRVCTRAAGVGARRGRGRSTGRSCVRSRSTSAHPYAAGQHRGVDLGASPGTPCSHLQEVSSRLPGTVPTGGQDHLDPDPARLHGDARASRVDRREARSAGTRGLGRRHGRSERSRDFDGAIRVLRRAYDRDAQGYVDPLSFLRPGPRTRARGAPRPRPSSRPWRLPRCRALPPFPPPACAAVPETARVRIRGAGRHGPRDRVRRAQGFGLGE